MSVNHHYRRSAQRAAPSHQIIIARGDEVHSFNLHGWMIWTGALAGLALTFWLFASTAYVMFRDDVLASMIARQTRTEHAYEDRIAALRLQVDRVTSRQLLDQDAFSSRLDEILKRQSVLEQRAQQVSALIGKARDMGVKPNIDPIVTGSLGTRKPEKTGRIDTTIRTIEASLGGIERTHDTTLMALEQNMRDREKRMRSAVAGLGVSLDTLVGARAAARPEAQGGPFIPLKAGTPGAFETRASYVIDQMSWLDRLNTSLSILPVRKPLAGEIDLSSGFGGRSDPFSGEPAFHAGQDFRGDVGDAVYATADGVVSKAGRMGGYGNLVEVTHKNGYITRYGHLSAISVAFGQSVRAGQTVGRVGSTGRSTGPHLHYETRIGKDPVDPLRFARAGQKLGMW